MRKHKCFGVSFSWFWRFYFPFPLIVFTLKILKFKPGVSSEEEGSFIFFPFVSQTSRNGSVSICWIRGSPASSFSSSSIRVTDLNDEFLGQWYCLSYWDHIEVKFSPSYIWSLPFPFFHVVGDLVRKSAFSYCGCLAALLFSYFLLIICISMGYYS